jgi:hypothetical protein
MNRNTLRALALTTLAVVLFLLGAWDARAQAPTPAAPVTPRRLLRGRTAVQALGNHLPVVAARHGHTPERLRRFFLQDPDLVVTENGDLLYTCSFPTPPPVQEAPSFLRSAAIAPLGSTFQLHSRPGAQRTIYLDFDGHTTTGTQWNSDFNGNQPIVSAPFDTDGNPGSFSTDELIAIQETWLRVAEDYAPFDVDVTTEDPGLEALRRSSVGDAIYGQRVVITPGASWYPSGGGVAFLGTFDSVRTGADWPCFVFYDRVASQARYIGEAASHETGHTLGLSHDGVVNGDPYFEGHGDWAPIMGVGYYRHVTQWSKGEYAQANNTEDDLEVMVQNGAPLRADDHGNTFGTATDFDLGIGSATGTITTPTDVDVFRVVVSQAGVLRLKVTTLSLSEGPNVDLGLHLYDSAQNHIAGFDNAESLNAAVTANLAPGTYYAVVSGTGNGDPVTNGYSNYGSLGNYTLVTEEPPFTLTAPNGGESWEAGTTHTITWTSNISGSVKLEYSTDGGNSWTQIIASTANDGNHNWTVPNNITDQARVRISSVADPTADDTSDANFTIAPPEPGTLTLLAPNGGETWAIGTTQSITWTSTNLLGNVRLEYSTDDGVSWNLIVANTANDGAHSWTVPNDVTDQARVRVISVSDPAIEDVSDASFSIPAPTLTVTSPNGGETWTVGTTQSITWTSSNLTGNVKLEYSTNGGATWVVIAANTANDGEHSWQVPNAPTTQGRVRITSVSLGTVTDTSDADFTIQPPVGGKLKAPKKGKFGKVKLGKTKKVKVVLQNTHKKEELHVNVSVSGPPFSIFNNGGANVIRPKKKLKVVVLVEPAETGPISGVLQVTSSDPLRPLVEIPLTGKAK